MHLIPVIDLLDNQVVHAKRGQREHYQAIQSTLCTSSAPIDIITALLQLYPFTTLYIADLNAIQKRGNHQKIIALIEQKFPQLCIWLDAGIKNVNDLSIWKNTNIHWVIGSESLINMTDYFQLQQAIGSNYALSLDFTNDGFKGPTELLRESAFWPQCVVAMTLAHVGSNEGAETQTLQTLLDQNPEAKIYAAGGIRNIHDLNELSSLGVQGALLATSLHSGQINAFDLSILNQQS